MDSIGREESPSRQTLKKEKIMKKILLTSLGTLFIAGAANASEVKGYIGSNISSMTQISRNSAGTAGGIDGLANSLFFGLKAGDFRFEVDPTLSYRSSETKTGSVKTETTRHRFGLGGNVFYDFTNVGGKFFTPFVGAGVSFRSTSNEVKTAGTKTTDTTTATYTLGVQGGVSLNVSESWNFDIGLGLDYDSNESKNNIAKTKTTTTGYGTDINLRLRYTF